MGGVENSVSTDKAIRSLERKQYSSNAELTPSKTEMKRWIEQLSRVGVVATNSNRPPAGGRRSTGYATGERRRVRRKRMVTTLRVNDPIPLFPSK
uniref:Ribosomal protein L23 n=1 Tax=Selaginella moellendorffii TaxID=88036 RepID=A0A482A8A4_SELML|nr:ribosomal protein L23 [Selaginella moellendorffii]